jgi:hypothetical protein
VTESARVTMVGANPAAVQALQNSIEALFIEAEHYQRSEGLGNQVFVEYRAGSSGTIWRSEILRGGVEPSAETGSVAWWEDTAIQALVTWRRRFFWEGARTELPLANGSGSGTGGRTVYNHDDAGHDNWVDVDEGDVDGVLPSPVELEFENTFNDSDRLYRLYAGLNAFSAPATFPHILEGEDAAFSVGGSSTASGLSSNGFYEDVTWAGDSEVLIFRWALSTSLLAAAQGNYFRLLARFASAIGSDIKITPKITFPTGTPLTVVAQGQETTLGTRLIQDLGAMQIPPWLPGETNLMGVDLCLYGRKVGGGTFNLDFVQLTPLDGYRVLREIGYGVLYGWFLVDDGIEGKLWAGTSGSRGGWYTGFGQQIHLWPGRDQRLYFLATDGGGSVIARTMVVSAFYRPRRITI